MYIYEINREASRAFGNVQSCPLLSGLQIKIGSPPLSAPRPRLLVRSLAGRLPRPSSGLFPLSYSRCPVSPPSVATFNPSAPETAGHRDCLYEAGRFLAGHRGCFFEAEICFRGCFLEIRVARFYFSWICLVLRYRLFFVVTRSDS